MYRYDFLGGDGKWHTARPRFETLCDAYEVANQRTDLWRIVHKGEPVAFGPGFANTINWAWSPR